VTLLLIVTKENARPFRRGRIFCLKGRIELSMEITSLEKLCVARELQVWNHKYEEFTSTEIICKIIGTRNCTVSYAKFINIAK